MVQPQQPGRSIGPRRRDAILPSHQQLFSCVFHVIRPKRRANYICPPKRYSIGMGTVHRARPTPRRTSPRVLNRISPFFFYAAYLNTDIYLESLDQMGYSGTCTQFSLRIRCTWACTYIHNMIDKTFFHFLWLSNLICKVVTGTTCLLDKQDFLVTRRTSVLQTAFRQLEIREGRYRYRKRVN